MTGTLNLAFSSSSSVGYNLCSGWVLRWSFAVSFMAIQLSLSVFVLRACRDLWAEVLDAEQEKGKWS